MSPIHRAGDDTNMGGATWESLTERLMRAAQERGDFDDLPFQGERIPLDDDSAAGERALGFRILRNAGVAPLWIETDKEIRGLLARRDRLLVRAAREGRVTDRLGREFAALVQTINRAIDALNWEAPSDRVRRSRLDAEAEFARLEAAARSDEPSQDRASGAHGSQR